MSFPDEVFGEIIYRYTLKKAIEDGVLIDMAGTQVPIDPPEWWTARS